MYKITFYLIAILLWRELAYSMENCIQIDNYEKLEHLSKPSKNNIYDSLEIRNQNIDEEFSLSLHEFFSKHNNIRTLTFDNCTFDKIPGMNAPDFSYLSSTSLYKLAMTRCGLTDQDMGEVLRNLPGYTEQEIDFSNNRLQEDPELFNKLITQYFNGAKFAIQSPILS